ncbi:MAG: insulinase family protein [Bacteroidetes bacterium]|nr:insulinase family protein [Bacteroidota bacterium]
MKKLFSLRLAVIPAMIFLLSAGSIQKNPFPEITRYKLPNGLEVIFAPYGSLPVTDLTFFINVGKKSETPGQQGLAELTATSLLMGNDQYSRIDEDRLMYRMDANISASANENFTEVNGEFLNENLEDGMKLLSAVLLHPSFPQADVDEEKGFTISQNKPSKMDIGALADMYGNYFTYGIAHPLGRHFYETQYSKEGISQIKEFYSFNYTPGNTKLVVTGKTDQELVKKLIEQYFGKWNAAYGEVNGSSYDIPPIKTKEFAFIPKEGAKQACLEWFKRAPDAGSKDMLAFRLANAIFSDRLGKDIREKKGFTYGIYSTYSETQNDGIFRAKTQIRNEVTYNTIMAYDTVLSNLFKNGATDAELKKFRNMMKTDILNVEEPSSMASLINPWVYKDYEKRKNYLADLDAIDLATVNKAIKKYFTPDCYKLMIAGDATDLADQLAKISGLQKMALTDIEKDQ